MTEVKLVPSIEASLATLSETMLDMRENMKVLRGFMESTDEFLTEQTRTNLDSRDERKVAQETLERMEGRVASIDDHMKLIFQRVDAIEQNVGGVVELSKSTFDIVTDLKKKFLGGVHDESNDEVRVAVAE
jgi:small nuclear ribonucleoprotein (snRNP)-like protein